jgi:hypothetical protein
MSTVNLTLCGVWRSNDVDVLVIEESANEAYAMGQAKTMEDFATRENCEGVVCPIAHMPEVAGSNYIIKINQVLKSFKPHAYESMRILKVDGSEAWGGLAFKNGIYNWPFDKDGGAIDLPTQTKELSLLISSTQNVHKIFTEHLAGILIYDARWKRCPEIREVADELGQLVDRIQSVLEEIRPPIDEQNAQTIDLALDNLLPVDLSRLIGKYMD